MKTTFFLITLLLSATCMAQRDPCRKIKREATPLGMVYRSPELKYVSVIKQCGPAASFCLHMRVNDHAEHFERTGTIVEFDDGTVLKDEWAPIDCRQDITTINSGPMASLSHSGEYLLQGFFQINDANIEKFVKRKVVSICVGNSVQKISESDGTRIRLFIRCMREIEKDVSTIPNP